MAKPYWDEDRHAWMVDDHGRAREATAEEVEAMAQGFQEGW
jgi:hypothetical protein